MLLVQRTLQPSLRGGKFLAPLRSSPTDPLVVAALRPSSFSQPCRLNLLRPLTPNQAVLRQTRYTVQRCLHIKCLVANKTTRPSTTGASTPQSSPAGGTAPPPPGTGILTKQRLPRPVSHHLGIYRPQITWYLSILNRITGSVLSGGFYIFGFTYLISPLFGWHIESPALVAAFTSLPTVVQVGIKLGVGSFFAFHCFNGVRHLMWDTGRGFGTQSVIRTGWIVVGLSAVATLVMAAM